VDLDPHRQHALCLHADVQVGRLAGDREVAAEPAPHDRVGRAHVQLLGFLVGNAHEPYANALLALEVLERAHHRRQPALHVVCPPADEPVVLDPRLELFGVAWDHVEMAVQNDARKAASGRTHLRHKHGQAAVLHVAHFDVAGFEPSPDKSCGGDQFLRPRGVIPDQPLGQDTFIDHASQDRRAAGPLGLGDLQEPLPALPITLGHPPLLGVILGRLELALGLL
jgi:hypothetical protein